MWESPIYKFKADIGRKRQDILIDVTGSAPNFSVPGKQLEGCFEVLLKGLDPAKTKILDFGGAKLRNTIHLLKEGFTVYACEFKDLFDRSKQASKFLEEAKRFNNFKQLVFPDDFMDLDIKFDVVLLINVLNIMPVMMERFCVLALCREKMDDDGRLFWYTQHGAYSESEAVTKLFDGLVTGKGRKYHMFYRDFSRNEIHDMLRATGFSFNNKFSFPMSGSNQSYVFNPDGPILVDKSLGLTELLKKGRKAKLKEIERKARWDVKEEDRKSMKVTYKTKIPTRVQVVKEINVLEEYLNELKKLKPGKRDASKYHQLIFNIFKCIFDNSLTKPKKEEKIANGIKRVDITFKNRRADGFFKELDEGYHITCPNIFIECKNYSSDMGTPEFSQLQSRLNKVRGQFGMLVCRSNKNHSKIKDQQKDLERDDKYAIVLEDKDVENLVKSKLENDEEAIYDFLEDKLKELI